MKHKRVTLFAGHYGSGKTNIAVNYALLLAREGKRAAIADLDIVNPYFRTKDSAAELAAAGVDLISPQFANSNVDLPALPAEAYRLVEDRSLCAVMDIGGDDRGAYALGRYTPFLLEENDYQMAFVANPCRPLTRTPEEAMAVMREIEAAGGLPFTAIVNNANLAHAGGHTLYGEAQRTQRPAHLDDQRGGKRGGRAGGEGPRPAAHAAAKKVF